MPTIHPSLRRDGWWLAGRTVGRTEKVQASTFRPKREALGEGETRNCRAGGGELQSWLTVAAWGVGLGAFIDFYIGKAGQRRVRGWLETWWLKFSDVRWGNLRREEALFAVQVMDRLFGSRLFSARRMVVVVAATFVFGGLLIALITIDHGASFEWHAFFDTATLIWLIFILVSFAVSFSLTRFAAISVARILTTKPSINFLGLLVLIIFQYYLLLYWIDTVNGALWVTATTYRIVTQNFPSMKLFSIIGFIFLYFKIYVVSFITSAGSQYFTCSGTSSHIFSIHDEQGRRAAHVVRMAFRGSS
jgi:hypothetical protein